MWEEPENNVLLGQWNISLPRLIGFLDLANKTTQFPSKWEHETKTKNCYYKFIPDIAQNIFSYQKVLQFIWNLKAPNILYFIWQPYPPHSFNPHFAPPSGRKLVSLPPEPPKFCTSELALMHLHFTHGEAYGKMRFTNQQLSNPLCPCKEGSVAFGTGPGGGLCGLSPIAPYFSHSR